MENDFLHPTYQYGVGKHSLRSCRLGTSFGLNRSAESPAHIPSSHHKPNPFLPKSHIFCHTTAICLTTHLYAPTLPCNNRLCPRYDPTSRLHKTNHYHLNPKTKTNPSPTLSPSPNFNPNSFSRTLTIALAAKLLSKCGTDNG